MRKFTKVAKKRKVFLAQKTFLPRTKEESQDLFSSVSSLVPNPIVAEVVGAVALRTVEGSSACKAPGKRKGDSPLSAKMIRNLHPCHFYSTFLCLL